MNDATLPLFRWGETRPVVAPDAPEGIQRAARAAGRADAAILAAARRHVGEEIAIPDLHAEVSREVECLQDTVRRRLAALAEQGLVVLGEPTRTGHVVIGGVR